MGKQEIQSLVSLDIETKCNLGCFSKCEHALFPNTSSITVIGLWNDDFAATFRSLSEFTNFLKENPNLQFVMHSGKFDMKHLKFHGVDIKNEQWVHDTQLMAAVCLTKVSDEFLKEYETQRKEKNKELPVGYSHREAKGQSLKTLAPFFLGVEPFWEDPTNHDNDEYVLKDCEYTYRLCQIMLEKMQKDGTIRFYEEKLFKWTRDLLLPAEERGVTIDTTRLARKELVAERRGDDAKKKLDGLWAEAYEAYRKKAIAEVEFQYQIMTEKALYKAKCGMGGPKYRAIKERYYQLCKKRKEKEDFTFNLNSDDQMLWLLKDYLKLDTKVNSRDKETNVTVVKDSTGVEVLNRLAQTGREDIKVLLDYREQNKLSTAFYPSYRELMVGNKIHTTFNATGTRTGRLSCSDPNLQQCPGHLHSLFVARPGYNLACFDESGIEARLIAFYSEDPVLCDLIINDKDIHGFHANIFFEQNWDLTKIKKEHPLERQLAKNVGFGLFYGAGPNRIRQEAMKMGYDWSEKHCRKLYNAFKETYSRVFSYKRELDDDAVESPVASVLGRIYAFMDKPEDIYMKCFNSLIQGSASDLVVMSAYRAMQKYKELDIDAHFLIAVHDELVFEVPEKDQARAVEILIDCMTNYELNTPHGRIPLKVEGKVGRAWAK